MAFPENSRFWFPSPEKGAIKKADFIAVHRGVECRLDCGELARAIGVHEQDVGAAGQ
jgi:hypothetical protein